MRRLLIFAFMAGMFAPSGSVSAQDLASLEGMFGRTLNFSILDSLDLGMKASVLFLGRSSNKNLVLVTNSFGPGGSALLTADDLDLKSRNYTDVSVFGRYRMFGVEYRRLDGPRWQASPPTVYSPGGAVVRFATPIGNTFFPSRLSASYGSDLSSWEVNARWLVTGRVALFFGRRNISLPEAVLIYLDIGPGLNYVPIRIPTDNPMSGWQIGVDGTHVVFTDRLELGGYVKMGRLTNYATAGTTITQMVGPGFLANGSDRNNFEFVEAGVEVTYRLFRSVQATLGYQTLRLNGVALAPSLIPGADPALGVLAFIPQDRVVFEGIKCGVVLLW